jgi:hypothetical protein
VPRLRNITDIDTGGFSAVPRVLITPPRAFAREPEQERSRASFGRAVDTAVALLVERRSAAFRLAEVAERSGVSIGRSTPGSTARTTCCGRRTCERWRGSPSGSARRSMRRRRRPTGCPVPSA